MHMNNPLDDILTRDGNDYDVLTNAVNQIKHVQGMTCEIGVRRGGGSRLIIDSLIANDDLWRHHIAVDPYGNIEYLDSETDGVPVAARYDYTNQMRNDCLNNLHFYTHSLAIHLHFLILEDTEFFKRYHDGVPVYDTHKQILNRYALVHLDGPHDSDSVITEFLFFATRMDPGAVIVFDDIPYYPHDLKVEPIIFGAGFKLLEKKGRKAAYIKI